MAIVAFVLSGIVLLALVALLTTRRSRRPAHAGTGDCYVPIIADGGDCGADGGGCGDGGGGGGD